MTQSPLSHHAPAPADAAGSARSPAPVGRSARAGSAARAADRTRTGTGTAAKPAAPIRVAVIGVGPRGLTVVDQLVEQAIRTDRPVEIHAIDPFPPGPGRVWAVDQPADLLMNTVIAEQTVFPDPSCAHYSPGAGPSMAEWFTARNSADGVGTAAGDAHGADTAAAEAAGGAHATDDSGLRSTFGTRVLYGEYLTAAFAHVTARAATSGLAAVIEHRTCVNDIVEPDRHGTTQLVRLADNTTLEVDDIVFCVGHIPSRLTDERQRFAEFAHSAGLTYLPPCLPAETPIDSIQPGEAVIFRGFGLNFFDLQALLTTGRGGRFTPKRGGRFTPKGTAASAPGAPGSAAGTSDDADSAQPWELVYQPSGREPVLAPSSRRGVPYRCKPITAAHPLTPYTLRFFTPENIDRLSTEPGALFFDDQLWPLILADIRLAWYTALHASQPEAFTDDLAVLIEALAEGVDRHLSSRASTETAAHRQGRETFAAPALHEVLNQVVRPEAQLNLSRLIRPMQDLSFAARDGATASHPSAAASHPSAPAGHPSAPEQPESLHDWMCDFLRQELADAHAGPALAPSKAIFMVLWHARLALKDLVAEGRLSPVSVVAEVRGWFESFVSGICDGPPPQRFAELLALAEAGLVTFVGPEVRISKSKPGQPAAFVATSEAVAGEVRARVLVDAASPVNNIRLAADTLVARLLERGDFTVATVQGDDGVRHPLAGPAVNPATLHPIDAHGGEHPNRYVLSLQLSAVQFGLAIAANPDSNARTLRDAHLAAAQIFAAHR